SAHRLYGIVDGGDLAYVEQRAMVGQPLQPHVSTLLHRVVG
ncbi:MAG: heme-binding beta-barrel domain-containing protein, partial [Pseudonocardiaceae bacterium]